MADIKETVKSNAILIILGLVLTGGYGWFTSSINNLWSRFESIETLTNDLQTVQLKLGVLDSLIKESENYKADYESVKRTVRQDSVYINYLEAERQKHETRISLLESKMDEIY